MATIADDLIANLLGAGGLVGRAFAQGRQNQLAEQQGAQELQFGQMKMAAAQAARQQAAQYQQDVAAYSANPTPQSLAMLMAKYPEQAEAIKKGYDVLEAPARESRLAGLFSLYNAAQNGRSDLASGQIAAIIKAEKAQGLDTADAEQMQAALASSDPAEKKAALDQLRAFAQAHLAIADPKFADAIGLGKQENHFGQLGSGGIFDQRTGQVVREPSPDWQFDANSGSWIRKPGTEGGGQASGGGGASGTGAPQRRMGWTPSVTDGGDNPPEVVTGKISSIAGALGISPTQPISPSQIPSLFDQIARTEGGPGDLNHRNNNPGNIRDGAFARSQPGYSGKGEGGYARFKSPADGRKAGIALLSKYYARGQRTVEDIIAGKPVAQASAAGNPNVVQVLPPKNDNARRMTPQEVAAEGLDPNKTYYRDKNGVPQLVEGQTGRSAQLTEAQSKATGYLSTAMASVSALNTVRGYNPSVVALGLNDLSNKNPLKKNLSQVDRRVLNAQLAFSTAVLRLESGAVVTPEEAAAKAQTLFPLPGDGPEVQADKRKQREAAVRALQVAAGPGAERVPNAVQPSATPSRGWGKARQIR